ncbi:MAG TPA: outer membrane lipid asymmetry maintenance protein MlaD [Kiloniellales bacterium]|jgi:phospholipid/cholesterol/gamma-HCH transport system substrate-binding protein|nr:outer membrane lipid asymmetry maintenance protein MlaD [Kiloniellales bacterium]
MRKHVVETVLGAVVLVVAIGFIFFAYSATDLGPSTNGYEVEAIFDDASGVRTGTEVRMSGVRIGSVVAYDLDPDTFEAVVTLSIRDGIGLPKDTSARILPDGLLGGTFVSLSPGGDLEDIPPGGRITYTQGSINLMDLLGRFVFSGGSGGEDGGNDAGEASDGPW